MKILTLFGTRPEAIKLAPVVQLLSSRPSIEHACCVTGQHREMLDQVLEIFGIVPDFDLDIMKPGQNLDHVASAVITGVGEVLDQYRPDWVVVQGDTTTAFAAALSAFHRKIRIAHVEAGLRTGNMHSPWPEEGNRRLIGQLASLHFPPTRTAAENLAREGVVADHVLITGNTVIDALNWVTQRLIERPGSLDERFGYLDGRRRLILVTGHRRENFDGGLERICRGLAAVADRGDVELIFPVHLNPTVQATVRRSLGERDNVHLIEPLEYLTFVYLMQRCYAIVTDSGGVQEEAPGLGKPVLVVRDTTERPEAIEAGTARLIGTSVEALVTALTELLDNPRSYRAMAQAKNPFGDGRAAERIVDRLMQEQ